MTKISTSLVHTTVPALSGHSLLCSDMCFRLSHRKRQMSSSMPKWINVYPLKFDVKKEELSERLTSSLNSVTITNDVEASWKSLTYVIYKTSLEVLGTQIRKHQDWFDDANAEVQCLLATMYNTHKMWINEKRLSATKHTRSVNNRFKVLFGI